MASAISLAGGAALGLASSLHCIGMCGGISVLLGYSGRCGGSGLAMRDQALLHGGRVLSYMTLGAIAGGIGSAVVGQLDMAAGHMLLRWAAALSLGWIGLAMTGLAPTPVWLGHASTAGRWIARPLLRLPPAIRRLTGGIAWGLMPCAMVYGALLFALFAGTASGGAIVMLGFGLGTLPALLVANLGFNRLGSMLKARGAERWLGGTMIAIAILSLVDNPAALGAYCVQLMS
jgi:hypothetical protein